MKNIGTLLKTMVFLFSIVVCQRGIAQENASGDVLKINLEKALEIALSDNPMIKVADKEIERVDYAKKGAWYGLIPTLNASAQAGKYVVAGKTSMMGAVMDSPADYSVTATLSLSLPLIVPALWQSIQMSDLEMQVAVEKARASKIALRGDVTKAFYSALLAQDSYESLKDGFAIAKQNYEEAKKRFDVGLAAEYDYISAEVQMHNLMPTLLQVENGIVQSKLYLKMLMGVNMSVELEVEGTLTDFEASVAGEQQYTTSVETNSDLIQLDIQQKQLQKQLQLQRSQRLPTLVGFGQFGYSGMGTNSVMLELMGMPYQLEASDDWFHTGVLFGLQLNVPIFNGMTHSMKEKQIKITSQELDLQRDYLKNSLELQVRTSLDNMLRAMQQMESNKKGMELATKGYTISQKRYETGAGTMLELNSALLALTQSRLTYNQSISDYLTAKAEYEKIIGQ